MGSFYSINLQSDFCYDPMNTSKVDLKQYTYELPENKIAKHPLKDRAASKLLHFRDGQISHHQFRSIVDLLPEDAYMFFNNTRVIPARILFHKSTGAQIEVFLLEPQQPSHIMSENMAATEMVVWSCLVGNAKKWKEDQLLEKVIAVDGNSTILKASWEDKSSQIVKLEWTGGYAFSEIVEMAGKVPLPPYIAREVTEEDKPRYQTVYSKIDGAVAAPTAGLHFTDEVISQLANKNIIKDELTLHVSAGTFQPLKATSVEEHPMHSEQMIVTAENIDNILKAEKVIAVGTTSMRTLESLYWFGVKLAADPNADFNIEKLYPYQEHAALPDMKESMRLVKNFMQANNHDSLIGETEIFIFPGYEFRVCDVLVTNFHLPGSTLILLVAAFVGEDWRKIYEEALNNDYRFLSYGDSSVLFREKS